MIPVDAIARAVISVISDPPPAQAPDWDFWVFLAICLVLAYRYFSTDHPVRR